jgi:hypothetical protein
MSKARLKSKNILGIAEGGTGATSMGAGAVGAVAQAAGIPTGAIIESGSNATGEYIRYADGTQICTRTVTLTNFAVNNVIGSLFYGSSTALTFAMPFISAPFAKIEAIGSGFAYMVGGFSPSTTVTGTYVIMSPSSVASVTLTIRIFAIGRWF